MTLSGVRLRGGVGFCPTKQGVGLIGSAPGGMSGSQRPVEDTIPPSGFLFPLESGPENPLVTNGEILVSFHPERFVVWLTFPAMV